jgi:hypothetical protein
MESTSPLLKKKTIKSVRGWPSLIGYAAIIWSVLYGFLQLYWLLGGDGYPFKHEESIGLFSGMITYLSAQAGGIIFVILCLLGIGIGIDMQRNSKSFLPRWFVIAYAWGLAASLILFVPDMTLIAMMGYAFMLKFAFNWTMFNQIICIIGAILWFFIGVIYLRKTSGACEYCGRTETEKVPFLVRWGSWITIIAAVAPLPYALSRFAWALNIPFGVDKQFFKDFSTINPGHHLTEWVFGSLCIMGGILTLGLIQKWGEIFPHWFPFIGGKRVPILLAVIPASMVSIAVTSAGFVFTFGFLAVTLHLISVDNILVNNIWGTIGPMIFWVPWGVSLGLATIAYYYRRRNKCSKCSRGGA